MNVRMDIMRIEWYLEQRLAWRKENLAEGELNAYREKEGAEIQAIEDVLKLIDLYGEGFINRLQELYNRRAKFREPHYDSACDKQNVDSWWLSGYVSVFNMFTEIKEKEVGGL